MGVSEFEATERIVDGVRVVGIRGEFDLANSAPVEDLLAGAARDTEHPLVIDLTECPFIDSTGLATLLHGTKPAQNGESHVALVSPGGEVRRLLALTAIDRTIPVFETLNEARDAVLAVGG
jgi:anti-anti-sigma factor